MDPTGTGFGALIGSVLSGGSNAVIALLLFILIAAFFIIRYLLSELKRSNEDVSQANSRYLKLLETYHNSSADVTEALNGVKMVLIEIKSKL